MTTAPRIYFFQVLGLRIRVANFGFQFSRWFNCNGWRSWRFGKRTSWSVIVLP